MKTLENQKEIISRFHTEDLALRASAVVSTQLVRELQQIHASFPIGTIAMGRLMTGALLMASGLAEKQQVSIRVQGNGRLGEISADASFEGETRAYCSYPHLDMPLENGHLPIGSAVGRGLMTVTRTHAFHKHPQIGIVEIQTGEIAEDLSYYYQQSQQIPTIVSLSVSVDKNGEVRAAGGVIVELMPGAPSTLIQTLERKALLGPPLSELLLSGTTPREMVGAYVHDSKLKESLHPHPLKYHCPCTVERVERTIKLLGKASIAEMILKGEAAQAKCQFCGRDYAVPLERLRILLAEVTT